MPKEAMKTTPAKLVLPFQPFYNDALAIGTSVEIVSDEGDTYVVKFPGKVGFSGSHRIRKVFVKED